MKREAVTRVLRLAVPLTLLAVAPAQAATKISSFGYVITVPGTYQVTADLSGSGDAIQIRANNVDLHLGGHTLSGDGSGAGVVVVGPPFGPALSDVSIHNGTARGFNLGVLLRGSQNCKVSSVTASRNTDYGFLVLLATGTSLTDNSSNQNFNDGIEFSECSRNSVTRNTANGNPHNGITVAASSANSVTNNTANDNGCTGIGLQTASGSTVDRNTTDRNGCNGIGVDFGSSGNTVTRNSLTANGSQGISLQVGSAQNTIQNNTVSRSYQGIFLGNGPAVGNIIQGNSVTLNTYGIWLDPGATGNTIQGNTALTNSTVDLEDDNPGCDSNVWANNKFATDLVAGGSDGGPGSGCIR